MKANRIGTCFILGGLLLIAAALCLTVFNIREQNRAAHAAADALQQIVELEEPVQTPGPEPQLPDYIRNPEMAMPEREINGQMYIGIVDIPALEISLPVISEWTYSRLQLAPCRFVGSVYLNNMVVMAHNYTKHFGTLSKLQLGDEVYFEDMAGNVFGYEVVELETLGGGDVEKMVSGDWDLTLFTCTVGGKSRVTVRCEQITKGIGE